MFAKYSELEKKLRCQPKTNTIFMQPAELKQKLLQETQSHSSINNEKQFLKSKTQSY